MLGAASLLAGRQLEAPRIGCLLLEFADLLIAQAI